MKPIKNSADHQHALARINQLWDSEPNTTEGDELEVLLTLVEAYETTHIDIAPADPIEAIRFRMEQLGLTDGDLTPFLGQRSRVSEVLNRKRGLSLTMIRKLHEGLHIPLKQLVSDYELQK